MHQSFDFRRFTCALVLGIVVASSALAVNGPGSLYVAGASTTPTHFNIQIGVETCGEIRGVGSEVGDPLPPTITVIIKSTFFGNTYLVGTQIGATNNYSFCYTPPAVANGDDFDACATTIVAYVTEGQNSNNDLIDDGLQNGSDNTAAGLRFVDANGDPIDCIKVGVERAPWSGVKSLYR
jgi:hypothetical protein